MNIHLNQDCWVHWRIKQELDSVSTKQNDSWASIDRQDRDLCRRDHSDFPLDTQLLSHTKNWVHMFEFQPMKYKPARHLPHEQLLLCSPGPPSPSTSRKQKEFGRCRGERHKRRPGLWMTTGNWASTHLSESTELSFLPLVQLVHVLLLLRHPNLFSNKYS